MANDKTIVEKAVAKKGVSILNKIPLLKAMIRHPGLYLLILPPLIYLILFKYVPMYGLRMVFYNYQPVFGYEGSPFVWFDNFITFFESPYFASLMTNTLSISVLQLILGFPFPIILAIALNEVRNRHFKQSVQMLTYAPHFISTVVMVSIIIQFLDPRIGILTNFFDSLGFEGTNLMGEPDAFSWIYVISGIWQSTGYSSIIFIAALTSIDPQMHEAAMIDGATKFQRILYIDLQQLLPTAIIMLILNAGRIMSVGFEKVYLMQNMMNLSSSEIISTYVYKIGIESFNFSYATTIGLFNSIINLILIVSVNFLSKKYSESSLF